MKKNAVKIIVTPTLSPGTVLLVSPGALVKRGEQVLIDGEKVIFATVKPEEGANDVHQE